MKISPVTPLRAASCIAACLVSGVLDANAASSGVDVIEENGRVQVTWPISAEETGSAVFSMDETKPLIESLGLAGKGQETKTIASGLTPVTLLTVGSRDLEIPRAGSRSSTIRRSVRTRLFRETRKARAAGERGRSAHDVDLGRGVRRCSTENFRFTFYRNSGLMKAETVMSTEEDGRAIVYDTGLVGEKSDWKAVVWNDPEGNFQRAAMDPNFAATPVAVQGRAIVAEGAGGSLAVFPAPHRFFYPQDEAFNLKFVWHGKDYGGTHSGYGIGIRQSLEGDTRFVPWFNAPPNTKQELGAFYLISSGDGKQALDAVAKYTRDDHYKPLPGYKTFTSHYHVEHTLEYLRKQKEQRASGVPADLETPGMVETFKARGVNIAHLAEFHIGDTPKMADTQLLPLLRPCTRSARVYLTTTS